MALHEEALIDHNLGRTVNANLGEYHVPVNADIHDIEVIFVEEPDEIINPLGIKGVGEIGVVGTAAAIANAIHHATGKRVRDLPITLRQAAQSSFRLSRTSPSCATLATSAPSRRKISPRAKPREPVMLGLSCA